MRRELLGIKSALGDATSFHLGSQGFNNAEQLAKDIHELERDEQDEESQQQNLEVQNFKVTQQILMSTR
ncbi:14690_t:CDS:2 [Funneliformis mosseae]|uniref:14690_t:CDS:1 n=1 Tax=Funneliformis mosseae TaxID=27381 RepID=A0A9N9BPF1_FUNMO|nr:14690_t:CDS:2 [Funneliformis mosseae]